jgi:hypothetical protein
MQLLRWPCTGIGLAVDNELPFLGSHLNRTNYLKEDDLVLVAAPIRPALYSEWLGDLPLWKSVDPKHKPVLLAHEWLALYEGEEPGPLVRHGESQWEALFDEIGYFSVYHEVKEASPGKFTEKLRVIENAVLPDPMPTLYRSSRHHARERWSWTTSPEAATNLNRADAQLYTTSEPQKVFGRIVEVVMVLPGSPTRPTVFEEFIVRPGDVMLYTEKRKPLTLGNTTAGSPRARLEAKGC